MQLHVETLFTLDPLGRLLRVNDAEGSIAPRFFLGRTVGCNQCWFRHDVVPDLVAALGVAASNEAAAAAADPPHGAVPYETLLARYAPIERTWAGPAYTFRLGPDLRGATVRIDCTNADLLKRHLPEWAADSESSQPMVASLDDGVAVAVCCSVRIGPRAHEAGVETAVGFRGRGHGMRVVAAWAAAVRDLGRVPLYSTSWANAESRAVAARLRLVQFGMDLHIR